MKILIQGRDQSFDIEKMPASLTESLRCIAAQFPHRIKAAHPGSAGKQPRFPMIAPSFGTEFGHISEHEPPIPRIAGKHLERGLE